MLRALKKSISRRLLSRTLGLMAIIQAACVPLSFGQMAPQRLPATIIASRATPILDSAVRKASAEIRQSATLPIHGPYWKAGTIPQSAFSSPRDSRAPFATAEADTVQAAQMIDLSAALRLADRANPEIGISRQAILENLARQQGARALLLPSLTAGTNYHQHNGNLQQNDGSIIALSQQAYYLGGGAGTLGSQTIAYPAIRIYGHLGDAIFEPLAARQLTVARQFDASATANSVLLSVSTGYLELMAAEAQLEIMLRSQRDAAEFVRVTRNFADTGQGRQADADRARTEARLIDSQTQRAKERVAVAAADLCRLLTLDPSIRLKTVGGPIPVLTIVDPQYSRDELIEVALRARPELVARSAQIAEAATRYRQERTRPLFPTVSVGFSSGMFGGGSNFANPQFGNFGGRTDFDVFAFWTARNLGAGNVALARGRRAQVDQATASRVRAVNLVRREVAEAFAASTASRRQIDIGEMRLVEAEAGFREEFARIRGGEGLPIELLDSLTRVISARQAMVTAITGYDQAQFRLFVALGQPPTLALPNARNLASAPGHKASIADGLQP